MKFRASAILIAGTGFLSIGLAQTQSSSPDTRDFATMKANVLARLETETTCVQAAATFDGLHACMPQPPDGGHRGPPPPEQ